MASSAYNEVLSNGKRPRRVTVSFYPQNTSAPVIRNNPGGLVTSVTRNAAGKFTIKLANTYKSGSLEIANGMVNHEADNVDFYVQGGAVSEDASGGATVVVKLKTGSVNTDIAASGTNRWVSVDLVFNDA